ncbi:MAG TPA: MASE1 domain-containing protein [Candidatus Acidoferrum sp.]|nr:MASE1 domain-containing protein [Candidatus Acidoferrum sp.]
MFLGTFLVSKTSIADSLRCLVSRIYSSNFLRSAGIFVFLFVSYVVSGKFGQQVAGHGTDVTVLWPPTGISLAALLILGYRFWPAIFLGGFVVNVTATYDTYASLGVATGNTLEALVGAYLVQRYANGVKAFFKPSSAVRFVLFAGILAPALCATIGVGLLSYSELSSWRDFLPVWLTWWEGDALAGLVLTPFLVLLLGNEHHRLDPREWGELTVLLICLTATAVWLFGRPLFHSPTSGALVVLCIPFLIWAAYRFCPLEAAGANLILCGVVTWSSLAGQGLFASTQELPMFLALFVAAITFTTLVVSAFQFERKLLEEDLIVAAGVYKSANDELTENLTEVAKSLDEEIARNVYVRHTLERYRQMLDEAVQSAPRIIWVIDKVNRKVHYVDPFYRNKLSRLWERLCDKPNQRIVPLELTGHDGSNDLLDSPCPFTCEESFQERNQIIHPDGARTRVHRVAFRTSTQSDQAREFHDVSIEAVDRIEHIEKRCANLVEIQKRNEEPDKRNSIMSLCRLPLGSQEKSPILDCNSSEPSGD